MEKQSHSLLITDSLLDVVGPGKFVTIKPIPLERLREYCEINHADANKGFREEFVVSWNEAECLSS